MEIPERKSGADIEVQAQKTDKGEWSVRVYIDVLGPVVEAYFAGLDDVVAVGTTCAVNEYPGLVPGHYHLDPDPNLLASPEKLEEWLIALGATLTEDFSGSLVHVYMSADLDVEDPDPNARIYNSMLDWMKAYAEKKGLRALFMVDTFSKDQNLALDAEVLTMLGPREEQDDPTMDPFEDFFNSQDQEESE
jgi:hypothetical protein